ncbi:hypothetical protein AOQ73_26800 [Bradyrhizobium pachyrhizi]|nr:hypothetical protein AOQ73_26800 [Bradyrhizobium pachyrhizi]
MGSSNDNMKRRLKPLRKRNEMRSLALALGAGRGDPDVLKSLESDPEAARLIGKYAERARSSFAAAYPGQTREKTIRNGDWDKAGYAGIAGLNRILGLKGS